MAVILIHLIYLAQNSVSFWAFFRLPFVRVMLVGLITIAGGYYYANYMDYKPYYKPEVETPYKYPQYQVYTQDSLFYDPKAFVPYLIGLKNIIHEDTTKEVSHPIALEEWKENLTYWTLVCENRSLISDEKDFNYSRLYLAHMYFMDHKYAEAERVIQETTIDLPTKNFIKGRIFQAIQKWDSAVVYYQKDRRQTTEQAHLDEIFVHLLAIYRVQNDHCGILECASNSTVADKMISATEEDRAILFCQGPLSYFAHSLDGYVNAID
ncbi:MAG: hypothetical protein K2Q22_03775, partial [Cytophagales bacterium]|nr:hypothetical protein [Cytophagales bacterium]